MASLVPRDLKVCWIVLPLPILLRKQNNGFQWYLSGAEYGITTLPCLTNDLSTQALGYFRCSPMIAKQLAAYPLIVGLLFLRKLSKPSREAKQDHVLIHTYFAFKWFFCSFTLGEGKRFLWIISIICYFVAFIWYDSCIIFLLLLSEVHHSGHFRKWQNRLWHNVMGY